MQRLKYRIEHFLSTFYGCLDPVALFERKYWGFYPKTERMNNIFPTIILLMYTECTSNLWTA